MSPRKRREDAPTTKVRTIQNDDRDKKVLQAPQPKRKKFGGNPMGNSDEDM